MNKKLTAAVLAAILPWSLAVFGADSDTAKDSEGQLHSKKMMTVPAVQDKTAVPVDLDAASQAMDVTLPAQPVHLSADALLVRSSDNYIQGRGNVDMQQGMDEMHANYLEGNTKSQVYYIPGQAIYINDTNVLTGTDVTYDSKTGGAVMHSVDGFMGPMTYIRGTGVEMSDGTIYIKYGLITTPHAVAKTPDYYLTGDDIRIYPGEKFVAENTKLWFKHICLLTYGHYEGSLSENDKQQIWLFTLLPRPTYNSDDGFGLQGHALFPLNRSGDFNFNVNYALNTKNGFKPSAKLEKHTKLGTFRFGYSTEESTDNDDNIWATKWPELEYYAPRIHFGSTGIYADSSASWGRWAESGVDTGTHKGFRTEITHEPLPLWRNANLRFFAGYRKDWYATDDAQRRDPYSGVVLNQGINDHLWTSFWYKKHNVSGYTPYRFDTLDDPRQKGFSVGYVLTPRDTFIFTLTQNLDTRDISDRNYTWVRDLHSFVAIITYKQVDKEWQVKVRAKDFDL
ncbi:hypothetical protein [Megasphaera cerevisiae]|uniref:hypothetical protein n=1 Tax=Megasphaera cerevisiae TaxID=39029 RepID=UPI00094536F6|nr:hypothetical protein [Megasphaera cerevisiae]OKY52898.1 hypothetical protein BSR42_10335 [Megasphaera cerevisiae]